VGSSRGSALVGTPLQPVGASPSPQAAPGYRLGTGAARLFVPAAPAASGRLSTISVRIRSAQAPLTAEVDVDEEGQVTHHLVHVQPADLQRWGRGQAPEELV